MKDVSGLPGIYLASNITGRWPPVLQAMLQEMVKGRNIADIWRAGCTPPSGPTLSDNKLILSSI